MITIRDLDKYYPMGGGQRFHALKKISLRVEQGEFIAICGKSGSGKSTLLNVIGCLDTFQGGEYVFLNRNMGKLTDKKAAEMRNRHIGFVLQDFSLINNKTVLFNVMLPLYFGKTPYKYMKDMALQALEKVGLKEQAHKRANQLSGGQRQRVAIARAIVGQPELILADEPTGALDSETSARIMELLRDMNESGITILVVTHDDVVAEYCRRKIVIKDGEILFDEPQPAVKDTEV